MNFKLRAPFNPTGDQPTAITELMKGLSSGKKHQTLLGVTGSGKTYTMANVIEQCNRPTLVISHNKTLVAQLYSELKEFFPQNAVEYFVSYFDYYQPEAYVPQTDTFIEKDSSINEDIDRLRLRATSSLLSRRDCIVVASVSCIYGLGSPSDYAELLIMLKVNESLDRDTLLRRLVDIQYERNDTDFKRGTFRVRGDTVDIYLAYEQKAIRVDLEWDQIKSLHVLDPTSGETEHSLDSTAIYPAKHYVTTENRIKDCIVEMETELKGRLEYFRQQHKFVEAQRLEQRIRYDMEMMEALGYCSGIENYSRFLTGRNPGERPYCLFDYFPDDLLVVMDESHVTLPQIRGMYKGDKARKQTLVDYGFRLPSALDNRPMKFEEFESQTHQLIYVSATPGEYELLHSVKPVEQLVRPTGLLDPQVEVVKTKGQIDHLIEEISKRAEIGERTLVTTLTKRMAEELSTYLTDRGINVKYIHSEVETIDRIEILRDLRKKKFDCLIGINLLREGLDLPEVSLVAILDADKEGFLRSRTSLIQTAGRAARHVHGRVILYADRITDSMNALIKETTRRRQYQEEYNALHGIVPTGILKPLSAGIEEIRKIKEVVQEATGLNENEYDQAEMISELHYQMDLAAKNLQFERAIELREKINSIKNSSQKATYQKPTRKQRKPSSTTKRFRRMKKRKQ